MANMLWIGWIRMDPKKGWAYFCSSKSWQVVAKQLTELAPRGDMISWAILAKEWGPPTGGRTTITKGETIEWDGRAWPI